MWNPDMVYQAEQARQAELYAEVEVARAVRTAPGVKLAVRLGRALRRVGERLEGAEQARLHHEPLS
jgi:hypothetical protein